MNKNPHMFVLMYDFNTGRCRKITAKLQIIKVDEDKRLLNRAYKY